ncbi:MAG TPA: response regulator [Gemmatimonadaceae bacterium]|nr:response regulator [Gemmatimonadaceae bacterium]
MPVMQMHAAGEHRLPHGADEYPQPPFWSEAATRPTVYVVDDDESMLVGLASLLRAAGYRVEAFHSALAFVEMPSRRPACVVLDLLMPELTGADLQRRLLLGTDPLPIIFISGYDDVSAAVEVMKAGALDFLRKPVSADDLLGAVERAIAHDRTTQAERIESDRLHARLARLTVREQEVLHEVVQGLLNKQVGARLGITERTVKRHRGMVMHKLGVASIAELVRFADRVVTGATARA